MENFEKIEICDKPKMVIELGNIRYDKKLGLTIKEFIEKNKEKLDSIKQDIKEDIKEFLGMFLGGAAFSSLLPIFIVTGIFGKYPLCTVFSPLVSICGAGILVFSSSLIPNIVNEIREYHIYKKNAKKIRKLEKKGLLKEYIIEQDNKKDIIEKDVLGKELNISSLKKEEEKSISEKLSDSTKSDINMEKPKKREIKYKETLITVENGKEVRKEIIKTTMHSPRYEGFKEFMIKSGASPELFELEAINDIIDYVIEYGDPVVMAEGRSPICYNYPNKDGTFNIYGRMGGYTVSLVYKMEYCNDGDPEHYIKLTKYKMNDGVLLKYDEGNDEIFINKEGNLVSGEIDVKSVNKKRFFIRYTDK